MPEDFSYLDKILTQKNEVLPAEMSKQYMIDLDAVLARRQARGMEDVLGQTEQRGFLRSGESLQNVSEQVLGPAEERRRQAVMGLVETGLGQGREERLSGVQFERQRQLAKEDFERNLQLLERKNELMRSMAILEAELGGEGDDGFGGIGALAGAAVGGVGGFLLGGPGGAYLGAGLGSSLGGTTEKMFRSR